MDWHEQSGHSKGHGLMVPPFSFILLIHLVEKMLRIPSKYTKLLYLVSHGTLCHYVIESFLFFSFPNDTS